MMVTARQDYRIPLMLLTGNTFLSVDGIYI